MVIIRKPFYLYQRADVGNYLILINRLHSSSVFRMNHIPSEMSEYGCVADAPIVISGLSVWRLSFSLDRDSLGLRSEESGWSTRNKVVAVHEQSSIMARRIPFRFGTSERLECLQSIDRFEIVTDEGVKSVCYAAKIKQETLLLPYRTSIDGYVLAVDDSTYYQPPSENISYHQSLGDLPASLPAYVFTPMEIVGGHLFWPALIVFLGFVGWRNLARTSSDENKSGTEGSD